MKKSILSIYLFLVTSIVVSMPVTKPEVRVEDKWRIREAVSIRDNIGETIWEGISNVPFVILLVSENYEYLFNHPNPSDDFKLLEFDTITNTSIYYRKTVFSIHFEATFPAVNGVSCVVMGLPENTQSKSSSQWILTLLHENFHQYQASHPQHYHAVNALDLANGDETGMWQLNYPFPYQDPKTNNHYKSYIVALMDCYYHLDTSQAETFYIALKKAKTHFLNSVSAEDRKYWYFQLWKEGMARYTEYRYLEALQDYVPSNELKNLKDFIPFDKLEVTFLQNQLDRISNWELSDQKRNVIYSLGMAEGMVMDRFAPYWQTSYLQKGMNLSYFE